jgi:RNA polymerase sigma-70 factor, ECF subfamily
MLSKLQLQYLKCFTAKKPATFARQNRQDVSEFGRFMRLGVWKTLRILDPTAFRQGGRIRTFGILIVYLPVHRKSQSLDCNEADRLSITIEEPPNLPKSGPDLCFPSSRTRFQPRKTLFRSHSSVFVTIHPPSGHYIMTTNTLREPNMVAPIEGEVERLFASARQGSQTSLGRLLTVYTNYLKLLVTAQLDNRLKARVSPSDIVQEAFFEAHRDFPQFRGVSTAEFVAWLRRIVVNNILRAVEQHVLAGKRDVRREVSLLEVGRRLEQSTVRLDSLLAAQCDTPSHCALAREREVQLADALAELPPDYRDIIVLRHIEGLSFEEVGTRMERSAGAVRMLWVRALKKLREHMQQLDGSHG